MRSHRIFVTLVAILTACSGSENSTDQDGGTNPTDLGNANAVTIDMPPIATSGYVTCPRPSHLGTFEVVLSDTFSSVQGQVANGVDPATILDVETSSGSCELLRPPSFLCDPQCPAGETCGSGGACVTRPENIDVGEATFAGLSATVAVTAREPVFFYNFVGDLPHPAFADGADVTVSAAGAGSVAPFSLTAPGTVALSTTDAEVPIDSGTGATVTWTPGAANDGIRVEIELNIANHGGTPGRIECLVEDSGSFTIPAELVDTLLAGEASGFPSLRVTRQGASATNAAGGCVDLRLKTELVLPVSIPGLVSCSDDGDCDNGETCLVDLTCG